MNCTREDFYVFTDTINILLSSTGYTASPHINSQELPAITTGNELGVFLFSMILCTMCFGVIIEYSTLFDKKYASPDIPLEHRKTSTGLFFLSFSITRNVYKIFNDPSPSGGSSLRIFDGIKVLAVLWVMLLHGYTIIQYSPIANFSEFGMFVKTWTFTIVQGGVFAIDIFLFTSAFLGTYHLLVRSN